jgi:hypothetical protein
MSETVTVEYLLADTRSPIRGLTFTRDILQSAAESFRPRPLYRGHRSKVIGRILTSACVQADDGEWELRGTAEIDLVDGESIEDYAGKGMSMSLIAYDRPLTGDEALIIAAEPGQFGADILAAADRELAGLLPGRVTTFYQFSEIPPPTVVVVLLDKFIDFMLGGSSALLAMGIADLIERRLSRPSESSATVEIRVGLQDSEPTSVIEISAASSSDEIKASVIEAVSRCVPKLVAARAARRRGSPRHEGSRRGNS